MMWGAVGRVQLPGYDWQMRLSTTTGNCYYANTKLGATQWQVCAATLCVQLRCAAACPAARLRPPHAPALLPPPWALPLVSVATRRSRM